MAEYSILEGKLEKALTELENREQQLASAEMEVARLSELGSLGCGVRALISPVACRMCQALDEHCFRHGDSCCRAG